MRFGKSHVLGFPCGSVGKESSCNAGDLGSIPGLGRSPGEGNGCPLQYSCLENPMDRGAGWATVRGMAESGTTARLIPSFFFTYCIQASVFSSVKGIHQQYFYPRTAGTTELALEELAGPWWSSPHSQRAFLSCLPEVVV